MKALFLLVISILSLKASAHPVIYKGGWSLGSLNMPMYSSNYGYYSLTHRFGVGAEVDRFSKNNENNDLGLLRFNALLWRKNGDDSQANFYLLTGAGVIDQESGVRGTRGVFSPGIEADWESRIYYTSFKYTCYEGPKDLNLSMTQARVGVSPIIAPFEKLQTWVIFQAMVINDIETKTILTPMLRFFYHNVLWEVGSSTRGDWTLNFMVHY
jgi:hypothetical protein